MEIAALKTSVKAAELPFEKLASNPNVSDHEKIAEASRQFEAVLLRQILQEARKTSDSVSSKSGSSTSGIYDDMVNNQLADSISRSGAFGLAASLQNQLDRQILTPKHAAKSAPAPLSTPNPNATRPPSHD